MATEYDAVIVGAGVIGSAIGLELSRLGVKTVNIDKNPAAGYGSTSNSCAIIRTHYSTLQGTAMAWESLFHWKDWAGYLGDNSDSCLARFRKTGVVMLNSGGGDIATWKLHHDRLGIPYEEWDRASLRERMPYLSTRRYGPPKRPEDPAFHRASGGEISGAFYVPEGGYISDPQLATHNLQCAAQANGGKFLFNACVREISTNAGRVSGVVLDGGDHIRAPIVVNAAGPHSFQINRLAGVLAEMNISTRPLRHEVHYVPAPAGLDMDVDGVIISDDDTGGYCRPELGNAILLGSQDPACDPREWVEDPDNFEREVTTEQWQAQVYRLALRIPDLPIPAHPRGIADLYDVTEDWIPIYDRSKLDGFYLAIGTSGNQFKNAPVVGQLMAGLIDACESGHDHDMEPVKYNCRHIDEELDLGFFSRLRQVNKDSSFSVLG